MVKGLNKEIIVIDDCSTDDTINIIKDIKDIIIISHEKTKARVLLSEPVSPRQTAILFLVQDADLEYDPQDILSMIKPIIQGKAEVVYGSRFTGPRRNMFFGIGWEINF